MEIIEQWLKNHRNQEKISPRTWRELPEELKALLDMLAHDEAVHRSEEFIHHGFIDHEESELVEKLIDIMTAIWMLPFEKVQYIVEEYLDSIPCPQGEEFIRFAQILFRYDDQVSWEYVFSVMENRTVPELIGNVIEKEAFESETVLSRDEVLEYLGRQYDHWVLADTTEATEELFSEVSQEDGNGIIPLEQVENILVRRGAEDASKAVQLERQVGVEEVSRVQLTTLIRRFALFKAVFTGQPYTDEDSPDSQIAVEENDQLEMNDEGESSRPGDEEDEVLDGTKSSELDMQDSLLENETLEAIPLAGESTDSIETEVETETGPESENKADSLQDKVEQLFEELESSGNGENTDSETLNSESRIVTPDEELSGYDIESEESSSSEGHSPEEEPSEAHEDIYSLEELTLDDGDGLKKRIRQANDRFDDILNEEKRIELINSVYMGNEILFDDFLVKVSSARDWSMAYQLIINELYQAKIEPRSEIGDYFYRTMKEYYWKAHETE